MFRLDERREFDGAIIAARHEKRISPRRKLPSAGQTLGTLVEPVPCTTFAANDGALTSIVSYGLVGYHGT
jgi:hypothetical protein